MLLSKSIEILEIEQRCLEFKGATDRQCAIKLGIEALKRVQYLYKYDTPDRWKLLPGETIDQ